MTTTRSILGIETTPVDLQVPGLVRADWAYRSTVTVEQNGSKTITSTYGYIPVTHRQDIELEIRSTLSPKAGLSRTVTIRTRAVETDADGAVLADYPVSFSINLNFGKANGFWDIASIFPIIGNLFSAHFDAIEADVPTTTVLARWAAGNTEL